MLMATKVIIITPLPEVVLVVVRKYNKANKHIIVKDNIW